MSKNIWLPRPSPQACMRTLNFALAVWLSAAQVQQAHASKIVISAGAAQGDILWLTGTDMISSRILDRLKALKWKGALLIIRYHRDSALWYLKKDHLVRKIPYWQDPFLDQTPVYCQVDFSRDLDLILKTSAERTVSETGHYCLRFESSMKECSISLDHDAGDMMHTQKMQKCVKNINKKYKLSFRPNFVLDDYGSEESRLKADHLRAQLAVKVGRLEENFREFFFAKSKMIQILGVSKEGDGSRFGSRSDDESAPIPPTWIMRRGTQSLLSPDLKALLRDMQGEGMSRQPHSFIKPSTGSSSVGTFVLSKPADFDQIFGKLENDIKNQDYLLQPFIDLPTVSMDFIVQDKEVIFFALHQNVSTCYQFYQEDSAIGGVRIRSQQRVQDAKRFAKQVLSPVGMPDGVFHLEAFYNSNEEGNKEANKEAKPYTFIEIARRAGGGFIPNMIRQVDGFDWRLADMGWQLGFPGLVDYKSLKSKNSKQDGISAVLSPRGCKRKIQIQTGSEFEIAYREAGWQIVKSDEFSETIVWLLQKQLSDEENLTATTEMIKRVENFCSN